MAVEVTVEDLKPQEVSWDVVLSIGGADQQGRFTGEGSELNLLHWLRHAEQAIDQLEAVRPTRFAVLPTADIFLGCAHAMHRRSAHISPKSPSAIFSTDLA